MAATVRVVCVDGPLAGAQATFPAGATRAELYAGDGTAVTYELTGVLSAFPGDLRAARYVPPTNPADE